MGYDAFGILSASLGTGATLRESKRRHSVAPAQLEASALASAGPPQIGHRLFLICA